MLFIPDLTPGQCPGTAAGEFPHTEKGADDEKAAEPAKSKSHLL